MCKVGSRSTWHNAVAWHVAAAIALAAAPARAEQPARPMLSVAPAGEWDYRHFRHTEFTAPNVRQYDANGYFVAALAAEVYPAARQGAPFWQDIGLTLDVARSAGLVSQSTRLGAANDPPVYVPVGTTFVRYGVGLRYRFALPAPTADAVVLGASIGYGAHRFEFDEKTLPPQSDLEVPRARYDLMRIGVDVRAPVGPVMFVGSATFLHAFSVGSLGNRTPAGTAEGVEAAIGVAVRVWQPVSVQASARYAVLVFNLQPLQGREGDRPARVTDSYVTLSIGPVVSL
jgi:hypothetical protein